MKTKLITSIFILFSCILLGQKNLDNNAQLSLLPTSKAAVLKDLNIIFNTRLGADYFATDETATQSQFSISELRFEIKSKIHEKVYFRFRNRYTKQLETATMDNMLRAVDFAHIIIETTPKSKLTLGKMVGNWGGYQLLLNPLEILSFNSLVKKSDLFLVGAAYSYAVPEIKSKFNFQLLNGRTKTFQEQYGITIPSDVTDTKIPIGTVANWNGILFDGKLETTYSYCYFQDAKNKARNHITLGHKYKNKNFILYYDFQYSNENLDNKLIVSDIIKNQQPFAAQNVSYIENWLRAEYKIMPKVNLLITVMNHKASWNNTAIPNRDRNLLTSYGVIPTIEYAPFSDLNMKFYAAYIGRKYNYSSYAESQFKAVDYSTSQFSFGIIAPLVVL
jgi:hypothetical protein